MYTHLFIILLPAALGEVKPDVHFDDQNDRFDLTALIKQGAYDQWAELVDGLRRSYVGSPTFARRSNNAEYFKEIGELALVNSYERDQYDHMMSPAGRRDLVGYLHGEQPGKTPGSKGEARRSGSAALVDKEVLVHHAVPIVMKIQGFMMPLDDE